MESIAIYGACGLVAGIFRESGKLFTALSFNIIFIIVTLYSGVFNNISFIEALVGTGIFLLIPKKIYNKISLEINKDKKVGHFSEVLSSNTYISYHSHYKFYLINFQPMHSPYFL